jgi:uncharacterized repeat protein (TIGR03803 family)
MRIHEPVMPPSILAPKQRKTRTLGRCKIAFAIWFLLAASGPFASAQIFQTLLTFNGIDGAEAQYTTLVQGTDGHLYGTTWEGGKGFGNVFKITGSGTATSIYDFCPQTNCPDGSFPYAGVVQAVDGNFYGTTAAGGAANLGTVFKVTPGGALTTLYSFCVQAECLDGSGPVAGLIQATDGNFYGTTLTGGPANSGTVFKITPAGTLTTLYSFCALSGCTDGIRPYGTLVQGSDHNFYGTTIEGGTSSSGTVFKIAPSGTLTTLHSFNFLDGESPRGNLIQSRTSNFFYGTTSGGGNSDVGTVFKISPEGNLTTVYSFCSLRLCADGEIPVAGLVQASNGSFYGTTQQGGGGGGGINGAGTIFVIDSQDALTTLYSFCLQTGCLDGIFPSSPLTQDTNGTLYGTTLYLGSRDAGTIFSLDVGLSPFVEAQPGSGRVGAAVTILGTKLAGASSVSFNGTAATFLVVSGNEIKTTVPPGATTGKIQVTTPARTFSSNAAFRVIP